MRLVHTSARDQRDQTRDLEYNLLTANHYCGRVIPSNSTRVVPINNTMRFSDVVYNNNMLAYVDQQQSAIIGGDAFGDSMSIAVVVVWE